MLLDAPSKSDCIPPMKTKLILLLVLTGIAASVVGCINTVTGTKTAAVPFLKDRVEARYERAADQVFAAAKSALTRNGTIDSAGALFNQTNAVSVVSGKVKQASVYIRVEALEPHLSDVTVQVRGNHGGADVDLAHEIDKEIALELSR